MRFPNGQTVTVVHRTTTPDPDGDSAITETRVDVPGCAVAPRTSTEDAALGRNAVYTGFTVFMPHDAAIDAGDLVEIDGLLYDVDGDPARWKSPFSGWKAGTEVPVKRHNTGGM